MLTRLFAGWVRILMFAACLQATHVSIADRLCPYDEENEAEGDRGILLYRCVLAGSESKARTPFAVILGLQSVALVVPGRQRSL